MRKFLVCFRFGSLIERVLAISYDVSCATVELSANGAESLD
jgi:hypothetical protein